MAWESALDRLLLQQVHLAEKGDIRTDTVRQQVLDLWELDPERSQSAFHLGYARVLLGLSLPEPKAGSGGWRYYVFGQLRAHDRRGERNWVAELIQDRGTLMELLREPSLAASCLPVVMRSLFGCGDLDLAINAIEFLASTGQGEDIQLLVDAALSDLLSRLENLLRDRSCESTGGILKRCVDLPAFSDLPADIRARYFRALGRHHLLVGDYELANDTLQAAHGLAESQGRLRSSIAFQRGLAALRLHDVEELAVRKERHGREEGVSWFAAATASEDHAVPEAFYGAGILAYETSDLEAACQHFDAALKSARRLGGRDQELMDRCRFYLAAGLLSLGRTEEAPRALRLLDQSLAVVAPDLESFYPVYEELKKLDRRLALKFLDALDIERGTASEQLLIVALEYLGLGEAEPAAAAAERVLQLAMDLDERVEAMRVLLSADNMRGRPEAARQVYESIRDLLLQRGAFTELESLLKNEDFVGQALDHLEIKCELVALYEEMEDRETEKATLQSAIARALRARKDVASMQEAFAILQEVEVKFPELVRDELAALEKLLALQDSVPVNLEEGASLARQLEKSLGHKPRILVVGGNERQRRHHPRYYELAKSWDFEGEWLMANYSSPQKLVNLVGERLKLGLDLLILLHWNRHETTEPALELARKHEVAARTVHYAGFTSLQVSLTDMLGKLASKGGEAKKEPASSGKGRRK